MKKTKKSKQRTVIISGKIYEVVTISDLAKMLGINTNTIRKYEQRKILPFPNYRMPSHKDKNGKVVDGIRLYTKDLAIELVRIFSEISQGKKITTEQLTAIRNAFTNEKNTTANGA